MKQEKNVLRLLVMGSLLISSCMKDDQVRELTDGVKAANSRIEIELSKNVKDPYNISNMLVAFQQLKDEMEEEGYNPPIDTIEPTGQYVRVLVHNDNELDILEEDTSVLWFDFPLDYEVHEGGEYYHDTSLTDSSYGYKYGVVPDGFYISDSISFDTIYPVFIPDESPDYSLNEDFYDRMEDISETICKNTKKENKVKKEGDNIKSSKWNPSAYIKAWDNAKGGYIPLQGVKVTARHYTKCRQQCTGADGRCTFTAQFKSGHRVRYGITWDRAHYDIRNKSGWQVYYNGPKTTNAWDLEISGQRSLMYATIHRVLHKAFYGRWHGIERPYATHRLKVGYHDEYREGVSGENICFWNVFGILNNIKIYGKNANNKYRTTYSIYCTMAHELGHQSMLNLCPSNSDFNSRNDFVHESWARCVGWYMTVDHYENDLNCYNHNAVSAQQWRRPQNNNSPYVYTPVFIDLIDTLNQYSSDTNYCKDNISGYTLSEIQNLILINSYDAASLRTSLLSSMRHGATEDDVNELMDNYNGLGF